MSGTFVYSRQIMTLNMTIKDVGWGLVVIGIFTKKNWETVFDQSSQAIMSTFFFLRKTKKNHHQGGGGTNFFSTSNLIFFCELKHRVNFQNLGQLLLGKKLTGGIVDTTFCLQRPRSVHILRLDQNSKVVVCLTYNPCFVLWLVSRQTLWNKGNKIYKVLFVCLTTPNTWRFTRASPQIFQKFLTALSPILCKSFKNKCAAQRQNLVSTINVFLFFSLFSCPYFSSKRESGGTMREKGW